MTDTIVIPDGLADRIKTEGAAYRAMLKRHGKQTEERTPIVAALTREAFATGYVFVGRKGKPEGTVSQADYAKSFGVSSAMVTKWRRFGAALALGMEPGTQQWADLGRVVNDKRVGPVLDDSDATLSDVTTALGECIPIPGGKIVRAVAEDGTEGQPGAREVALPDVSAANVVRLAEHLSAQVVAQWEAWDLSPETAADLLAALTGAAEYVAEQKPTSKRQKRSA